MVLRTGQFNFSKGEIAEELVARIDVASYQSAVKTAYNVVVLKYGGLAKRPGTRLVAEAWDGTHPVRLLPFQFSLTQAFALEMGQYYMRPAATGGLVIEDKLKITAITKATNALVTAAYHGYSVGEEVYFAGITGMTQINGRFGKVLTTPTADTFTVDINTTGFSTFTGSDGITRTGTPAPPPSPPPPPPAPPPPPPPADTGGGGGFDDTGPCVTADSLIWMANAANDGPGGEKAFWSLRVGEYVWTRHGGTGEWGAYPVAAITFVEEEAFRLIGYPDATALHRFAVPAWLWRFIPASWRWFHMFRLGKRIGRRAVGKASISGAQTYMARRPVPGSKYRLSHNLKPII